MLVIGGAASMPGSIVLAATAALRAGAGKLQIATVKRARDAVGLVMPEARVFALPETNSGAIAARASAEIVERAARADAVLIGPGMLGEVDRLMARLVDKLTTTNLVLDAEAMRFLARRPNALHGMAGHLVLTPHAGEFAALRGLDKHVVAANPLVHARAAAAELGAVVVLKGANTFIVAPDGTAYENRHGGVGLATSGSGDVLAGIIAGLLARGCDAVQAAAWGVHLHARAGEALAARIGDKQALGFLARELPAEIPALLFALRQA